MHYLRHPPCPLTPGATFTTRWRLGAIFALRDDLPCQTQTEEFPGFFCGDRVGTGGLGQGKLAKKPGKLGAGEANRTPDPNLGKVMLYP